MKGISIIICTYNGSSRLPQTLRHLAAQQCDGIAWEVILVNNGSTDNADIVASQIWRDVGSPVPMRVLNMPAPGKSHALTLGFQEAKYDYLVICDDDNWLMPDYLRLAFAIMEKHPDYGIVGGRAEAVADKPLPEWFYEMQYAYACGCPHNVSADITGDAMLWGAGMVLRKQVALAIMHPQCPTVLTGRKGKELTAGEDDEKCVRTWLMGYKTLFDYRLQLQHYMPEARLNASYATRLKNGFQEQGPYIAAYRRLFDFQYRYKPKYHPAVRFSAWLLSFITGKKDARRISAEFLFIATGNSIWKNDYIANAIAFRNFIAQNKLMYSGNQPKANQVGKV